jgi:polysaccharide biosynthesis/export protein
MSCFRISRAVIGFMVAVVVTSCASRRQFVYFQDAAAGVTASEPFKLTFKKDDLLSVQVMAMDPEAIVPFNLPLAQQIPNNIGGYAQGAPTPPGYLIDHNGDIELPVLGKIHAAGLTRPELSDTIRLRLAPYLTKPSVNIRILNYKVTVLGEVRNPGTYTIPNERITLPEALGIAGDLQITGIRKNVKVIRHEHGRQTEMVVDLTSKKLFDSPAYYLQQSDIVYVEPNRTKINSSTVNTGNIGIIISVISLLVTTATLLSR